ncbi:tail fiber assembly protein [Pseudomonas sp. LP_7_YM]|uniref:tail fiber assembly protein n=1 Tax=Pseudomonas sp. LP_7_YM TaxID=2485137 RepID=UPI00106077C0|nr:tail fiber assembly protein [Pseudomonas sp. LP_7_YM]TDV60113.1 virus tail fiber assembly protein lambda gpK [Pseudomonas sp. LP_7_YM]
MARYAVVENSLVINVMLWDGDTENWAPPEGQTAALIPEGLPVTNGTRYVDSEFILEVIEPEPPLEPTPQDILRINAGTRDALLLVATTAIAPLQDAVDLDDATTSDVALLKKWKQYRVAVNRINLTLKPPSWPDRPK